MKKIWTFLFIFTVTFLLIIIEFEANNINVNNEKYLFSYVNGTPRYVEIKKEEPVINVNKSVSTVTTNSSSNNCSLTSYEAFCSGCSGFTANGTDVRNNSFYYDATYGNIYIVAADSSIPFGTIIKFSGIYGYEDFLAIVLDRGGAIGFDGGATFDLLLGSYNAAVQFGRKSGTYQIVRLGF